MKHRIGFNRLGRKASHRKAMCRNMITSLFEHERISTTKAKALEVRRMAEKMITRAKVDSVHNRRIIAKDINDKKIVAKLFTAIGPRFVERQGGYTRILKTGLRNGDAAEMVLLELVEKAEEEKSAAKKKTKAKKAVVEEKEVAAAEEIKDEEVKAEKPKAKPKAKTATKAAAKKSSTPKKDDKSEVKKTTASKSKAKSATKPAKETKTAEKKAPAKKAATKKTTTKEKTDT